jgi:hypothetical protein
VGALRSALSSKLAEEKLTVVGEWKLESHKTKLFRQALGKLNKETRTILLVEDGANVNLERASRNIEGVTLVPSNALVPYDLMRHDSLMLSREAAEKLSRALSTVRPEAPVQIEPAPAAPAKKAAATDKGAEKAAPAKTASKTAKKPSAAKKEKSSAKPKAKKG